jgi:methionyl-tRNA formyltransferase
MVETPRLRLAFFGTPRFAVPTLEALARSRHEIVAVVSQPDSPRGRGQRLTATDVKRAAQALGLPVLQPVRLKEPGFRERFAALQPDLGVVAAYGKILPDWLIETSRLGLINVHASLLPRYRGAAPVHRAIMAGETGTGVSIMRVVSELDAGPVFASVARPIAPDATGEEVARELSEAGAALLVSVVDAIAEGRAPEVPQDAALATYAPKIAPGDYHVDWSQPAIDVHNRVRALWPDAWTVVDSLRLRLLRTSVDEASGAVTAAPGEVLEASGDVLRIAAGRGAIRVGELQPAGRRAMSVRDFLNGHRLLPGARLT